MGDAQNILVIGASGQIGSELTMELRNIYKNQNVVACDVREPIDEIKNSGVCEILDVLDGKKLSEILDKYQITQIYHLAALLSATGERNPKLAWKLNVDGLINVLDIAVEKKIKKIFWPSTIAIFGPTTPKINTPQKTVMEPSTVYGISKLAGELWCEYYFRKFNLDIRSLRYPGLISYKTLPGGGTTDYAVEIFYEAVKKKIYQCFLSEETCLPMMYMPDAIRGTIQLMESNSAKIGIRTSYNFSAISFTPKEIAEEIKKNIPDFTITYQTDFRQQLAESWPQSIDDTVARKEWGWNHKYDLPPMVNDMLKNIRKKIPENIL